MALLNLSRIPEFQDPWFVEIETIWNELEASVNDIESRLSVIEAAPFVINVAAASPLSSTGGTNPTISIQNASGVQTGALTSTDWNTFNQKISSAININTHGVVFGTGVKEISSTAPLLDGQIVIGRTGLEPLPASITGTANQVNVNSGPASITLSLPQSIHTGATPTFDSLNLTDQLSLFGSTSGQVNLLAADSTTDYSVKMPPVAPASGEVLTASSTPGELEWKVPAAGTLRVDYFDPVSTVLPSGPTVLIDGQAGVDGDLVLFSNLSSGNNRIYELSGVGVSINWTALPQFSLGLDPSDGESVRFKSGDGFKEQLAVFNGTAWEVNKTIRLFNGADYWELESLHTSTLLDNTTDSVFEVTALGSENIIVYYSLLRGTAKDTGQIILSVQGTDVECVPTGSSQGTTGVSFTADVVSGDLRLRYTTTNTGSDAEMKYFLYRWSDAPGGPAGVPSYTPAGPSPTAAAGNLMEVQFHGSGGILAADSSFKWDSGLGDNGGLNLEDLEILALSNVATINNDQTTPLTIIEYSAASYPYCMVEYGITRGTEVRVGRLLIPNNGSSVTITDDYNDVVGNTGVTFTATIVSGNVRVQYVSTDTGVSGTMKYTAQRWA